MPLDLSYNNEDIRFSKKGGRGTEIKEMIELEVRVDRELKER
jgi:hypothetical protein